MALADQCISTVSFGQIDRGETEGEEHVGQSLHNVREGREEGETEGSQGGSENSDGEVEELTQVVDLMNVLCDSRWLSPEVKETVSHLIMTDNRQEELNFLHFKQ